MIEDVKHMGTFKMKFILANAKSLKTFSFCKY